MESEHASPALRLDPERTTESPSGIVRLGAVVIYEDCVSIALSDESLALFDSSLARTAVHSRLAWRCMFAWNLALNVFINRSRCCEVRSFDLGMACVGTMD